MYSFGRLFHFQLIHQREYTQPAPVALLVASQYVLPGYSDRHGLGSTPRLAGSFVSSYSSVCFEIKFSGRHRGFDGVLFKL